MSKKTSTIENIYAPIKPFGQSVFWRGFSLVLLISCFMYLYNNHPYYLNNDFNNARNLLNSAYAIFLVVVFPYTWLTLKFNYRRGDDFQDPSIIFFVFLKRIGLAFAKRDFNQVQGLLKVKRFNNFLLKCAVKGFFLPLMCMFVFHHIVTVGNLMQRVSTPMSGIPMAHWFLDLVYNGLFIVDTGIALVGYGIEIKWFNNKTKSVEPTAFGWIVAIMCYPPFNSVSGQYFPLVDRQEYFIPLTEEQRIAVRIVIILLYMVFVWGTIALGFKFSNLSNKGIVARGPYKYIRHPAYAAKNVAWWFEHIQFMKGGKNILPLLCWNTIYTLRALTEERHLMKDPEYQKYCKKVKYRFIPGVI